MGRAWQQRASGLRVPPRPTRRWDGIPRVMARASERRRVVAVVVGSLARTRLGEPLGWLGATWLSKAIASIHRAAESAATIALLATSWRVR
jgi:hypothetical protein